MPESAEQYVAEHGEKMEAALSEALGEAIAARAASPVRFISEHLKKAAAAQQQVSESQGIARLADFRELRALGGGCAIAKTEERGITLPQLRAVKAQIDRRCVAEAWTDWEGRALRPETVSLYDAAKYVIKPATVERQCSFVELFASAPQLPKWFVSHWWGEPVRGARASPLPSPHPLSKRDTP